MSTRTIGGWALLANAVLTVVLSITTNTAIGSKTFRLVTAEMLVPLLIIGLVAIGSMLPHSGRLGRMGQIGLWCLGIAAGIAFVVMLTLLVGTFDVGDFVPLSSAVFAFVGSLLVGWATIRSQAFLSVFGWLLIVNGVLNLTGGLLPGGPVAAVIAVMATFAEVVALAGFGWTLLRGARGTADTQLAPVQPR
jgi:hypothetical protein